MPNPMNVKPVFNSQVHMTIAANEPVDRPIHVYAMNASSTAQYAKPNTFVHQVDSFTNEVEKNAIVLWINGDLKFEKQDWNFYLPRMLNGFLDIVEIASHYSAGGQSFSSVGFQNMNGLPLKEQMCYGVAMLSETASQLGSMYNMRDYVDDYRYGYLPGKVWVI